MVYRAYIYCAVHTGWKVDCRGDIKVGCRGDIKVGCRGDIKVGCRGDIKVGCRGDIKGDGRLWLHFSAMLRGILKINYSFEVLG